MARPRLIEKRMSRFLRDPMSVNGAASVIVLVTALVVVVGGVLIRIVDETDYPDVWLGMWWALQTVTTVGYGDATPHETAGRIVAVLVMLEGVAFLTIVVAAITSVFVARERRERDAEVADGVVSLASIDKRLDDLQGRLDRIETSLTRPASS